MVEFNELKHEYRCHPKNKAILNNLNESIESLYLRGYSSVQITKITTLDNNFVLRYLNSFNIVRDKYYKNLKYKINNDIFKIIDTEEKAYWLGFIYADGCVDYKNNLRIRLGVKDIDHLYKFSKFLNVDKKLYVSKNLESVELSICDNNFVNTLNKYGIKVNKAYENFKWEFIPNNLLNHFLRGVYDGDGGINNTQQKYVKICLVGGYDFMLSVQEIMKNYLKIFLNVRQFKHSPKIWMMSTAGTLKPKTILDALYKEASIFLDRKHIKYKQYYYNGKI